MTGAFRVCSNPTMSQRMKPLALALCLFLPFVAEAQLLENPGFESGDLGWVIKYAATASVAAEAAHDGKLGLRLHFQNGAERAHVDSAKLPIEAGRKVKLGFWARASSDQTGGVVLQAFSPNNKPIVDDNGKPLLTIGIRNSPGWTRFDKEITLPDEASSVAIAIRSWTGSSGTIDVDDFELTLE